MNKTIFDGLTFDVNKFATFPKCIGSFQNKDGAGCLLTAFWYAFGFKFNGYAYVHNTQDGPYFGNHIFKDSSGREYTVNDLIINIDILTHNLGLNFIQASNIMTCYDYGRELEALDMIWKIIEKLPNKTGFSTKENVIMPVCKEEVKV